jgi:hypothetical protein
VNLQPGTFVRFNGPNGKTPVDVVMGLFTQTVLLRPYAENEQHPAVLLTDHSWCFESDILEIIATPDDAQIMEWHGMDAINMAETPGRLAGPGFERPVVKDWVEAAGGVQNVSFRREWNVKQPEYPLRYPPHCWMWSMMTPEGRYGFRFTRPFTKTAQEAL